MHKNTLIEKRLDSLLKLPDGPHVSLYEAARYTVLSPGKRLRPKLCLEVATAFGASLEIALDPACALELIHSYSLIHDDLPCMDDDDFRRGKLSLHKAYNEAHAVLTGDFLQVLAFEVLANSQANSDQKVKMVQVLAKRSGGNGMVGGQVLDLTFEGKIIDPKLLQMMHQMKTGALITASFEIGGILANVSSDTLSTLSECGKKIGLAFQIVDDILDVSDDETTFGKPLHSDRVNHKATAVTTLGINQAKQLSEKLLKEALLHLPQKNNSLRSLLEECIDRKA